MPNMIQVEPGDIAVNKSDEFFIGLGKQGQHSFVMAGVMQQGKPVFLARVGKTNDIDKDVKSMCRFNSKLLFSQTEAELAEESLRLRGNISYTAYTINYKQYLQLIKIIGLAKRETAKEAIKVYQPLSESDNTIVMRKKEITKPLEILTEKEKTIKSHSHGLSIGNTCRHTSIELIEYAQGIKRLTDNISRYFWLFCASVEINHA